MMQDVPPTQRAAAKSVVVLLLTFTAGTVDVVGYINVYHLFAANMTGNTVHLGNNVAIGDWMEAAKAAAIISSFVAGSVVGRALIESGARRGVRRVASVTLVLEAVLITVFVWTSPLVLDRSTPQPAPAVAICGLLALLAAAMGLQTATLTRVGPLTIHTTFVTGMLNKFAQAVSQLLFWAHDEWRKGVQLRNLLRPLRRHPAFRVAKFMAAIWFCYMAGALAGTFMNSRWSIRALYSAVLLLFLAAGVDQFRPLSLEEEKEQP
jgi:uncharacterized membrane protein YoaK (UPF0700 family)